MNKIILSSATLLPSKRKRGRITSYILFGLYTCVAAAEIQINIILLTIVQLSDYRIHFFQTLTVFSDASTGDS